MKPALTRLRQSAWWLLIAIATGCSTLDYRNLQSDFEKAARADLQGGQLPYVDWYQNVSRELTPGAIAKLDPTLQPNAWLLRSFAQWRSEEFAEARTSVSAGLAALEPLESKDAKWTRSRDKILLTMAPGLVKDSELQVRFREKGVSDLSQHFKDVYQAEITAVLRQFKDARSLISEATPPSVSDYWAFQTWRVLQNWATLCVRLPGDDRGPALTQADEIVAADFAEMLGGADSLKAGRAYLTNQLGPDHLYLQAVRSAGNGRLLRP